MDSKIDLAPTQKLALDRLLSTMPSASMHVLRSAAGQGRTTILRMLCREVGGTLVGAKDFMDALMAREPSAIEEAFLQMMMERLQASDIVFVDDFHLIRDVVMGYEYPRRNLIDAVLTVLGDTAATANKKLVFGIDEDGYAGMAAWRGCVTKVGDFTPADYEAICRRHLAVEPAVCLDYSRIHRFAPMLNLWQLRNACASFTTADDLDTDKFAEYLGRHNLISNVDIEEVRPVQLNDIKGVDDVIQALEIKIALPFENPELAQELDLRARRGVLLAGPPGTGKTTIGRALAHRLKSKFFLIDGTAICGSNDFYDTMNRVFGVAKQNAPSIIFIDDADVMFEGKEDRGLYRYLLTMMDGLESASAERVCVMLTAMDPSSLPPALLRSGRVELWLETRLPDTDARAAIFRESLTKLPSPIGAADCEALAIASQGLTGADLRSVVEDGKLLFAHDKATGKALRPIEDYFLEAIDTVRQNRRNYGKRRPAAFRDVVKIGFDS
jgi:AAA+ superfamily predicted ATPase